LWNQFLEYLPKKFFEILIWMRYQKRILCFDLTERQRGAAGDNIRAVFPVTEPTSPMTKIWYTEEG
jgi:hypothetical protein